MRKVGFAPVVGECPVILILGTLPGDPSIARQQYYGHPQNAFWWLIGHALGDPFPDDYSARLDQLKRHSIALWDVLQAADRKGSSDSAIRKEAPNDVAGLIEVSPSLRVIIFNGQKAQALFKRHISRHRNLPGSIALRCVPSSSPLAILEFKQKAALWRAALSIEP